MFHASSQLPAIRAATSRRASSWDRSGGNDDCLRVEPGQTAILADISGAGMVTHLYFTMIEPHLLDYRDAVLRMFWDGETAPSVEVPLGDFFCISNCVVRRFTSAMVTVNPGGGPHTVNNGLNCYFPMPFSRGARIELVNQGPRVLGGAFGRIWYHIDYEVHAEPPPSDWGRFHAQWRHEQTQTLKAPLSGRGAFPAINRSGADNYVMLEARGQGHVAGLFLEVDNLQGGWYGEGDDMVFVDGEVWPPAIHGTGTEEVFGGGACPDREYAGPYTGFHLIENLDGETFRGKNAMYRWYLHDPIRFQKTVRMTIEHGHANDYANDYSSVVYWYQYEPHALFPALPAWTDRHPIFPAAYYRAGDGFSALCSVLLRYQEPFVYENIAPPDWLNEVKVLGHTAYNHWNEGACEKANTLFDEALRVVRVHSDKGDMET